MKAIIPFFAMISGFAAEYFLVISAAVKAGII